MKTQKINRLINSLLLLLFFAGITYAQDVQKGVRLYETDQFNKARTYFLELAAANPSKPEVLYYTGEFFLKMGNKDSAKIFFNSAIKADDENMYSLVAAGVLALMDNDKEKYDDFFKDAVKANPKKTILAQLRIADAYLALGLVQSEEPIDILLKAKEVDRKNPRLYDIIGNIYFARNDGSKAIENYRMAKDFDRTYVMGHVGMGRVYNRTRNFGAAESSFNDAVLADSTHAVPYKELSELNYGLKKYDKAVSNLKTYISLSEETLAINTLLVKYLYQNKSYNEAIDVCDKILAKQPESLEIVQLKGYAFYKLDDYKGAAAAFGQYFAGVDEKKLSKIDYEYFANSLYRAGNEMQSVQYYLKLQELDTASFENYGTIGDIYFKSNKWAETIQYYKLKEAKSGKGLSTKENYNLAFAYYRSGELVLADTTFGLVIEKNPELALAYFWRARAASQIDSTLDSGLAKPHYEKFAELALAQPDKYKTQIIEAYTYLGAYYIAKKDTPEFKKTWKDLSKAYWYKIQAIDPGNKQAEEVLKNIK